MTMVVADKISNKLKQKQLICLSLFLINLFPINMAVAVADADDLTSLSLSLINMAVAVADRISKKKQKLPIKKNKKKKNKKKQQQRRQLVPSDRDVPDEIIFEILSWLPVKSLLRFRCVCKSWRALISRSDFVTKHLSRAVGSGIDSTNSAFRLLLIRRPPEYARFPGRTYEELEKNYGYVASENLPQIIDYQSLTKKNVACTELDEFPHTLNNSKIVGSCNGLLCLLGNYYIGFTRVDPIKRILLWNPSTRKTHQLPDLDYFEDLGPLFYGFGYDSTTQDYKVVLGRDYGIATFALKTGSWKTVDTEEEVDVNIDGRGCLLNGALHWIEHDMHHGEKGTRIWCLDLAVEKLRSFSFITHDSYRGGVREIGTIGNCLSFLARHSVPSHNRHDTDHHLHREITIWVMLEYGVDESWTIFQNICMESMPLQLYCFNFISILEDGEFLFVSYKRSHLVLYKPKEQTHKIVLDLIEEADMDKEELMIEAASMYVETLVSPVI